MSHDHDPIICPNCGYHATDNYCAQCGQETHLHNDSFWGLIMHFIGHYFHYDSKFWSTMKALWFSPGKLTIAYKEKKRMRYIPPVSLYIFISVVFFLAFSIFFSYRLNKHSTATNMVGAKVLKIGGKLTEEGERLQHEAIQDDIKKEDSILLVLGKTPGKPDSAVIKQHIATINTLKADDTTHSKDGFDLTGNKEEMEKALHFVPKIFFFMIPIMGLVLWLLFIRRKGSSYTSHIIFALHYHTFWFSFMLLLVLLSFIGPNLKLVTGLILLVPALYMIISLRKVYAAGWGRAIFYSFVIGLCYLILFILVILGIDLLHEKCGIALF